MGLWEEIEKNKDPINELRRRLSGSLSQKMLSDDVLFLRFLVARNFNMNNAEQMLNNHLKWRKLNSIDTILTEFVPPEASKYFSFSSLGRGKNGYTTIYVDFGNLDAKGFMKSMKKNDILKVCSLVLEREVHQIEKDNAKKKDPIYQLQVLANFENFSLTSATNKDALDLFVSLLDLYESNYPERLYKGFFINTSYLFTLAWAFLKPFASPNTREKLSIFTKDDPWKEELVACIGEEYLPAFLGGSRTDPDGNPMCNTFVRHGGKIPESYYVDQNSRKLSACPDVKKVTVKRKSAEEVALEVSESDSRIEWEFQVTQKSIGFQLLFRSQTNSAEDIEMIPNHKVDTSLLAESGMLQCESPGFYILRFDNTDSLLTNKDVYYRTAVILSED